MCRFARLALLPAVVLVAGTAAWTDPSSAVGTVTPDPSYGEAGVATLRGVPSGEPPTVSSPFVWFSSVDPLGRTVAVGSGSGPGEVWRLTPTGEPDVEFSGDGIAELPEDFEFFRVAAGDDEVVVGGAVGDHAALARLRDDGTPDVAFDGDGVVELPGEPGANRVWSVDLRPDGSVTAVAGSQSFPKPRYAVHRLGPDGSPVLGFGDGGVVEFEADVDGTVSASDVVVDDAGRTVVVDYREVGGAYMTHIHRLRLDGSRDPSFGVGGTLKVPGFGSHVVGLDAADGSVVVGGATQAGAAVLRVTPAGELDRRFGDGGIALAVPGSLDGTVVWGIAPLPDRRVAVMADGGESGLEALVSVLRADGLREPAVGSDGVLRTGHHVTTDGLGVGSGGQLLITTSWEVDTYQDGESSIAAFLLDDLPSMAPVVTSVERVEGAVSVSWDGADVELGSPVRSYVVLALDGEGALSGARAVPGDVHQVSVPTTAPVAEVVVLPYDELGAVLPSEPFATEPPGGDLPEPGPAGPVVDLAAAAGVGFVEVAWAPPAHDGGAPIAGYSVLAVRSDTGELGAWRNVPADLRSLSLPGLTPGVTYDLYVLAHSAQGFGQVAAPVAATPTSAGDPARPPAVAWASVAPLGGGQAVVTWGPPVERGEAIARFHVVVVHDGQMTVWRAVDPVVRQAVVPAVAGDDVYVFTDSPSGWGPFLARSVPG